MASAASAASLFRRPSPSPPSPAAPSLHGDGGGGGGGVPVVVLACGRQLVGASALIVSATVLAGARVACVSITSPASLAAPALPMEVDRPSARTRAATTARTSAVRWPIGIHRVLFLWAEEINEDFSLTVAVVRSRRIGEEDFIYFLYCSDRASQSTVRTVVY